MASAAAENAFSFTETLEQECSMLKSSRKVLFLTSVSDLEDPTLVADGRPVVRWFTVR